MQMPAIHINGTSAEALLEQYTAATEALFQAIRAVEAIECNGRDYYTISNDAASVAMHEKRVRIGQLTAIRSDLNTIAEYIAEQAG